MHPVPPHLIIYQRWSQITTKILQPRTQILLQQPAQTLTNFNAGIISISSIIYSIYCMIVYLIVTLWHTSRSPAPYNLLVRKAKAYRPVALECTLGKVMESITAEIMSYLTETHELLSTHHYGGRPGRSAEDAMMVLSESIYNTWKNKKVYTALFMDVAGAFNNVHHERLIHNLNKRRLPTAIAKWIGSFL